ncbi:LysR family transcriptional regulator [Billgrantia endophytica]|nr:LysR substrate-binding domain-containing protein [Halomonas endophytica]
MKALAALESVVRTGSVSAAAGELGVTHGAVSKQLALLEDWLERPLFSEKRRGMSPNSDGVKLAEAMGKARAILEATLDEMDVPVPTLLNVVAPATLAMRWLIPRLPAFHLQHPSVSVRVRPMHTPDNWDALEFDVMIRRAESLAEHFTPRKLFSETLGLVVAPSLAGRPCADLPYIEADTRPGELQKWRQAAGMTEPWGEPMRLPHFYIALEAALSGNGALVVPLEIIEELLMRGALVEPWPNRRVAGSIYRVGIDQTSPATSAAKPFVDWLVKTVSDAATELNENEIPATSPASGREIEVR